MNQEKTLCLPSGSNFNLWEKEQVYDREIHVDGNHPAAADTNDGTLKNPLKTINAAAFLAKPGTRVWIHGGIYRECVHPARGGSGIDRMISYEAYGDGEVLIKASYQAKHFNKSEGWNLNRFSQGRKSLESDARIWEVKLDPDEFRGYNPFCAVNILHDRLFIEYDKTDMTTYLNRRGMVFCDGKPLYQVALYNQLGDHPGSYWVEANGQTVHFRLENDEDPTVHSIELTCREQCFAPEVPFLSFIKVKGLTCAHAATGAPVPQRGAISCYRGHHWIIEDCTIDWANGVGIDIGNECWHHSFIKDQIIGSTIIRRCKIFNAGVCGIAGLFAKNLLLEDNLIQGTGWQKMELSWEAGGIKVHNCTDSLIRRNIFTKTIRADHLWMDVGNENNRITQNLFLDGINQREAIFIECSRDGINLIDNNIFWNIEGRFDSAAIPAEPGSSGWYKMEEAGVVNGYAIYGEGTDHIHIVNNFIGKCRSAGYYAKTVAFRITGDKRGGTSRDTKIWNNVFYDCKEAAIKMPTEHNESEGNLFLNMPGGYLRILYPAPAVCLDLQAWQEFYGFDMEGQEGYFDIKIDTENFTMEIGKTKELPMFSPRPVDKDRYILNTEDISKVKAKSMAANDFYGNTDASDLRIPGPFLLLTEDQVISIDPRKL
ncbi:right-handed parallel beta-helix repeat-containing protein [Anaerocolumna sedimenticola]|uniref:Right-handed parallel beta-helix repeat-containing protein n=1 Tax=Anaerocolumna sedimenticola TaxID=2696063 RepID=A0A6P1TIE7_9FIRM|nr:right-handed parallel beta-helix repeat-containing protein [Anaerocolumna sedimenticola]QHQ59395.1 right-handed parallel beta-helix repeat-containing protein [Anaerocolumna sedimenticola]